MSAYQSIFDLQKSFFLKELKPSPISLRVKKLRALKNWIKQNEERICSEIKKDFNKGTEEVLLSEIKPILDEINHSINHIYEWTREEKVPTPIAFFGSKSKVIIEPKGVTLIIAPWNYPFNLCIGPLVSAITAGNTSIIKPSENTPHTAELIKNMIAELFQEQEVTVTTGDNLVSQELLKLPFDHIFFTGSPQVGKIIMKAASENLTSVTLELGGRNPVIVDETANIKDAAQKIVWGKFLNSGQTCIAPNYIYVHESIKTKLEEELINQIEIQFSEKNTDTTRIVNKNHFDRINNLLESTLKTGAVLKHGGNKFENINYLSPTLLTNVSKNSPIFQDEIFGPVLPILSFNKLEETLQTINEIEKPLALYVFSKSRKNQNFIIQNSCAGTTAINETTIQFAQPNLPFGGVNSSGLGKAHGKYGFLEFSNQRAILKQRVGLTSIKLIMPPYSNFKKKVIRFITFKM
ncbi:aldehyde dehydrogenase family protein [bacterium]|nr:aldehyde dehydrogenase family protein [bacterium]